MASAALVAAGLLLFGQGAWIYVKAGLAQVLLRRAWTRTLAGGKEVKPWSWADTWPVARLTLPGTGGDWIVLAGASGRTLAFGPGHLDGTAEPGEPGRCVLSAHRDTHFRRLGRVSPGDPVLLETSDRRLHRYEVVETRVARAEETWRLAPTSRPILTLVTCYPFDAVRPGGPLRYLVTAVERPSTED